LADTDTSQKRSRAENEASIRAIRGGTDSDAPTSKKRGSKKLLLIVLLAVLLGGGGAAYKLVLAKAPSPHAAVPEPEEPASVELYYLDLDPLFIPFQTEQGARHKIVVMLSLEIPREREEDRFVRSLLPRLREAYVRALTSRPFPGIEDGSIETVYLKNRIRAENIKVLGIGIVNDVLVRDIRVVPG
jgi:flagellar basal body-associated protein FliL